MKGHQSIGQIIVGESQIGEEARLVACSQQNELLEQQLHLFIIVDKLELIFKQIIILFLIKIIRYQSQCLFFQEIIIIPQ
jgi:hypothetical protein